jgi:hypothetical protein
MIFVSSTAWRMVAGMDGAVGKKLGALLKEEKYIIFQNGIT